MCLRVCALVCVCVCVVRVLCVCVCVGTRLCHGSTGQFSGIVGGACLRFSDKNETRMRNSLYKRIQSISRQTSLSTFGLFPFAEVPV